MISGAIKVGTRAIKSHYTIELQQDMAAAHGQDVEALFDLVEIGTPVEIKQALNADTFAQCEALGRAMAEKLLAAD